MPRSNQSQLDRLLDTRICDLNVSLEGSAVDECIDRLRVELHNTGLGRFRPHFWVADEWCSPVGVPGVGVPFYLLSPQLMKLEKKMMFEVEGRTRQECMQLLRHEAGHAFQHAYNLQRKKRWQKLFGKASDAYPDMYRPDPMSQDYVQHLDGWYAQAHPVEDFAETFAVWLAPRSDWRQDYGQSLARKKLQYMGDLAEEFGNTPQPVRTKKRSFAIFKLKHTLRQHYERRQAHYSPGRNEEYDSDLLKVFATSERYYRNEAAAAFLRRNRKQIREQVSLFTGKYQITVDQVMGEMIERCRELKLRLQKSERQTKLDFAIMLTMHSVHLLHRRDKWHPL